MVRGQRGDREYNPWLSAILFALNPCHPQRSRQSFRNSLVRVTVHVAPAVVAPAARLLWCWCIEGLIVAVIHPSAPAHGSLASSASKTLAAVGVRVLRVLRAVALLFRIPRATEVARGIFDPLAEADLVIHLPESGAGGQGRTPR